MEDQLKQFDQKVADLQKKSEQFTGQMKEQYNQSIDDIQQKQKAVREKLNELNTKSGKAWEDVKNHVDKAMDVLSAAYEDAVSRFK